MHIDRLVWVRGDQVTRYRVTPVARSDRKFPVGTAALGRDLDATADTGPSRAPGTVSAASVPGPGKRQAVTIAPSSTATATAASGCCAGPPSGAPVARSNFDAWHGQTSSLPCGAT